MSKKREATSSSVLDSPKGMSTTMTRNVKGQVTFDTLKSPNKPQSATLTSTSQLSNSMKKIGGNSQNSFSNDTTRYMDATKSRKAAWGPTTAASTGALHTGALEEPTAQTQTSSVSPAQTKTLFGSSSAWLMDFR